MIAIIRGLKYSLCLAALLVLALLVLLAPLRPVIGAATPTPTPTNTAVKGILIIDPVSGPPGTEISIYGSGFHINSTYKIYRDSTLIANDTVNTDGTFNTGYTLPLLPAGDYKFTAVTSVGDTTDTAAIFTVKPIITLATSAGKPGDEINITGKGFLKSGLIPIYFDNIALPIVSPLADATGSFNGSFTVPETTQGLHSIIGKDTLNYTSRLNFTVNPTIKVAQTNTSTDSQISVTGSGFSGSSSISFYVDGEKINTLASSSLNGSIASLKIAVPTVSSGSHTLKVMDSKGFFDTSKITVTSSISISPGSGTAGTSVRIKGSGFTSKARIYVFYHDQVVTTEPAVIMCDTAGNFAASFKIPASESGSFNIRVTDGANNCNGNFTLTASAQLEKTSGTVGSEVTVNGSGFKAGTGLNIKFDNTGIASDSVGPDGIFATTFKVPSALPGLHKVLVTDSLNPISLNFYIEASAQISTSKGTGNIATGNVGSPVTVSGNGFTPEATVSITYDSEPVGTAKVGATGSFSAVFSAPPSQGGNHIVAATDGVNEFSYIFVMETIAPSAPVCLFPLKDDKGEALTKFQWLGVTDPSGVTYRFQISKDPDFKQLLMDKNNLSSPVYQLTQEEKLQAGGKNQPYYWRVQASDNASNSSPWSPTSSFYVGFVIPAYFLYSFFGLVGLVVFAGGCVIGTRWGRKFKIFSPRKNATADESSEAEDVSEIET